MPPQSARFDDPRHRLPWVMGTALLFWGALLYAFALLLGHMSAVPDVLAPIDAELIEERVLPKPAPHPMQPRPRPVRVANPVPPARTAPSPAQPVADTPSPPGRPVEAPASLTPVSLPEASLPSGNTASRDSGLPAFKTRPSMPPAPSTGSAATPPMFGAAYLNNPRPVYPPAARKMGMEGTVMLKVLVGRKGNVLEMEVAQSSNYELLDRAASEAVKSWRFVPARRGDSAVDEWVQVPVAFHLKK